MTTKNVETANQAIIISTKTKEVWFVEDVMFPIAIIVIQKIFVANVNKIIF
jgi:hypothetical protein